MRIYAISPCDNVQLLDMDVEKQIKILRPLGKGKKHEGLWEPLSVWRLKKPRKRRPGELCDFTTISAKSNIPVMSSRAKKIFEPMLGASAQWLPLDFEECQYWILNSLNILDSLDLSETKISYLPNGLVWGIDEYAFKLSTIANEWLFKVPQKTYDCLATDQFRSLVEKENLTGFYFQPMWDSEHKPFPGRFNRKNMLERPEIFGPEGFVPNAKEYWPPEWKNLAKELKKK